MRRLVAGSRRDSHGHAAARTGLDMQRLQPRSLQWRASSRILQLDPHSCCQLASFFYDFQTAIAVICHFLGCHHRRAKYEFTFSSFPSPSLPSAQSEHQEVSADLSQGSRSAVLYPLLDAISRKRHLHIKPFEFSTRRLTRSLLIGLNHEKHSTWLVIRHTNSWISTNLTIPKRHPCPVVTISGRCFVCE